MVSNQLSCLRGCGLVESVRDGRHAWYRLADPHLAAALDELLRVVLVVDPSCCSGEERSTRDRHQHSLAGSAHFGSISARPVDVHCGKPQPLAFFFAGRVGAPSAKLSTGTERWAGIERRGPRARRMSW